MKTMRILGSFWPTPVLPVTVGNVDKGLKESDTVVPGTVNIGGQYLPFREPLVLGYSL